MVLRVPVSNAACQMSLVGLSLQYLPLKYVRNAPVGKSDVFSL